MPNFDAIQGVLCVYMQSFQPYYEPLRALTMPQRDRVQGAKVADREEFGLVRVLDLTRMLDTFVLAAKDALGDLHHRDSALVTQMAAYPTSQMQFDFSRAARAWVEGERGVYPPPVPHIITQARHARKKYLCGEWLRIRGLLEGKLGGMG